MNTNIEYIHDFLENVKDDSSLFERILDDIHDSERLNNGDDKHKVYYLQLTGDDNSGEKDFWVANVRHYFHLYVYAMLFNWKERWADDEIIKSRIETLQNNFSSEIASEIKKFNEKVTENVPPIVLSEIKFISDAFLWRCTKEVPHFTEGQIKEIDKYHSNYGRYITLINSDKQEDIAKDIDKYLSYCMAIDEVYENTDCLTSFIIHLSGTGDNTVNFDTILKSIPAESWGINTIRQSLIKGEQNIPADIIKLVIYSKSSFNQNEIISDIDEGKRKTYVKELLDKSSTDSQILIKNHTRLTTIDKLKLASYIRDNIVDNKHVSLTCNNDAELNASRQELLDKIATFQKSIINSANSLNTTEKYSNKEIKDFSLAKKELVDLLTREIESVRNYIKLYPEEASICNGLLKHIETCERIISRCNTEKYVILLMGEYQSGKTTTLDAFCGGTPVGAIGEGDKTSAVPLAISYGKKEEVIPIWKELDDLNNTFLRIYSYFPSNVVEKINISDDETRKKLKEVIEIIRDSKNRKLIPQGDLQYFVLCSLILEYFDTPSLNTFKEKSFSINEVHQLSRFPREMLERWEKGGPSSFKVEEAVFIFIKQFECFCSSQILKNMNCILLDCPGLFASDYDTLVTETAMKDANAILFIFPRDKEGGEQIEKSLNKLKNQYPDFQQKLLFANNVQLSSKNAKTIFKSNTSTVKRIFGESTDVILYDAMLSYIGQIKKTYDLGALDPSLEISFINEHPIVSPVGDTTYCKNFNEAWYQYFRPITSPDEVLEKSGFAALKNVLISFAEKNKAYSLILADGIEKLKSELKVIQHYLYLSYIEPYLKSKEELQNQWEEREEISAEFEKEATSTIKNTLFSSVGKKKNVKQTLADSLFEKLFSDDVIKTLKESICDSIYDNVKDLKALKDDNKEEEYIQKTNEIVSKCINNMIEDRIRYCNGNLSSNQDKDFQSIFIPIIQAFENSMDILWDGKYFCDDTSFKGMRDDYYRIKKDTSEFSFSEQKRDNSLSVDKKKVSTAAIFKNAAGVGGAAISLGSYGVYLWACAVSGPIGWLLGGLVGTVIGGLLFWVKTDEYNKKNFREKMMPDMEEEFRKMGIVDYLQSLVANNVDNIFNDYIKKLKVDKKKLSQDKTLSMSTQDDPYRESNCFYAVSAFEKIDMLISQYNNFYSKL